MIDPLEKPLQCVLGAQLGAFHRDVHAEHGVRMLLDVVPRDEITERAGIGTADGILVDEYLETSAPNVFAAGDVARAYHPLLERSVSVEHWANAQHQGVAGARNMLGPQAAYNRLPYFYSDQYDLGMEYPRPRRPLG